MCSGRDVRIATTNSSGVNGRWSDAGATVAGQSVTTVEDPNAGMVPRRVSGKMTKDSSVSELREAVAAAASATTAAASSVAAALGLAGSEMFE